jgi:probable HAF family extracellular repeat protein
MASIRSRLLLLLALCFIAATAMAQRYTVTDLGPLTPTGINSWAQVVGNYNGHAYIWTNSGGLRDLGLLPGGKFSDAAAINDLGVVTGTADGPGAVTYPNSSDKTKCTDLTQPFIWTPGIGMRGLNVLAPHSEGAADCAFLFTHSTGINLYGQVVGYNQDYETYQWGYLWSGNTITQFGGSWSPTSINAINNTGRMVGQDAVPWNLFFGHATSWSQDGSITDLATLDGETDIFAYSSAANAVNDLGQVVGWSTTTSMSRFEGFGGCNGCPIHAVLWAAGGAIRDLGTLPGDTNSLAAKINFFGQVIGSSGNAFDSFGYEPPSLVVTGHPFIWTKFSGMQDLNRLIPAKSGWILNTATDINVWGQIVGHGTRNGQTRGYLLTPTNPFQLF